MAKGSAPARFPGWPGTAAGGFPSCLRCLKLSSPRLIEPIEVCNLETAPPASPPGQRNQSRHLQRAISLAGNHLPFLLRRRSGHFWSPEANIESTAGQVGAFLANSNADLWCFLQGSGQRCTAETCYLDGVSPVCGAALPKEMQNLAAAYYWKSKFCPAPKDSRTRREPKLVLFSRLSALGRSATQRYQLPYASGNLIETRFSTLSERFSEVELPLANGASPHGS